MQVGEDRRDLHQRVLEHLLDALLDTGAVANEVEARPGEVADVAHLLFWHEARAEHRALGELGQPDRVELVALRPTGDVFHLLRVHEPDREPRPLEDVEEAPPIVRRRLQDDPLDTLFDKMVGELGDPFGRRRHLPYLGHPLAGDARVGHAGADHSGGLGDVDRGDTFHDLVLLVHLELLRVFHRLFLLTWGRFAAWACPGVRWELQTLTGVLVATVRDPSKGAPAPG